MGCIDRARCGMVGKVFAAAPLRVGSVGGATFSSWTGSPGLTLGSAALCWWVLPVLGKSTLSDALAQRMSRAAVSSSDLLSRLVVRGYVWPLGSPRGEAEAKST